MNDYIFPEAVLAALIAVAGAAASVNAAIAGGPTHVRMSMDAEVFRQDFGQVQQQSHRFAAGGGEESMDFEEVLLLSGELENNPLYEELAPLQTNPIYEGAAPPGPTITAFEFFDRSCGFLLDGKGTREFTAFARITDSSGAVYTSTSTLIFTGETAENGRERRHSRAHLRLSGDVIFSNSGDIEWILSSDTDLRLSFVPSPAAVTPLLAGLVAVRRRR